MSQEDAKKAYIVEIKRQQAFYAWCTPVQCACVGRIHEEIISANLVLTLTNENTTTTVHKEGNEVEERQGHKETEWRRETDSDSDWDTEREKVHTPIYKTEGRMK
jgi:hypothetical protein